jgi:hypothetical protein
MVSTPEWNEARVCERCVALAQADAA